MWPRFNSQRRRHMWTKSVVRSLLCPERFSGFPLTSKTNLSKFQFDQESGRPRNAKCMCCLQIVFYLLLVSWGGGGGGGRLSPNSRYPPSLHAFKNWRDKSNVAWFLRRQISDTICQFKKSRLSLFILDNRKWRTDEITITAIYGWKWSLLLFGGSSDGSYPHSKQ